MSGKKLAAPSSMLLLALSSASTPGAISAFGGPPMRSPATAFSSSSSFERVSPVVLAFGSQRSTSCRRTTTTCSVRTRTSIMSYLDDISPPNPVGSASPTSGVMGSYLDGAGSVGGAERMSTVLVDDVPSNAPMMIGMAEAPVQAAVSETSMSTSSYLDDINPPNPVGSASPTSGAVGSYLDGAGAVGGTERSTVLLDDKSSDQSMMSGMAEAPVHAEVSAAGSLADSYVDSGGLHSDGGRPGVFPERFDSVRRPGSATFAAPVVGPTDFYAESGGPLHADGGSPGVSTERFDSVRQSPEPPNTDVYASPTISGSPPANVPYIDSGALHADGGRPGIFPELRSRDGRPTVKRKWPSGGRDKENSAGIVPLKVDFEYWEGESESNGGWYRIV